MIELISGAQSLLAMWTKRVENVNLQRHVEFYGRLASDGNKAQLYPNIEDESNVNQANNSQNTDRQRYDNIIDNSFLCRNCLLPTYLVPTLAVILF